MPKKLKERPDARRVAKRIERPVNRDPQPQNADPRPDVRGPKPPEVKE